MTWTSTVPKRERIGGLGKGQNANKCECKTFFRQHERSLQAWKGAHVVIRKATASFGARTSCFLILKTLNVMIFGGLYNPEQKDISTALSMLFRCFWHLRLYLSERLVAMKILVLHVPFTQTDTGNNLISSFLCSSNSQLQPVMKRQQRKSQWSSIIRIANPLEIEHLQPKAPTHTHLCNFS